MSSYEITFKFLIHRHFQYLAIYIVSCAIFSLLFSQGPKQYPYNNLYLEKGGDPGKEPEEVKNYGL